MAVTDVAQVSQNTGPQRSALHRPRPIETERSEPHDGERSAPVQRPRPLEIDANEELQRVRSHSTGGDVAQANSTAARVRLENFAARSTWMKSPGLDFAAPCADLPDLIDFGSPLVSPRAAAASTESYSPQTAKLPRRKSISDAGDGEESRLVEDVPWHLDEMNESAIALNETQDSLRTAEQLCDAVESEWVMQKVWLLREFGKDAVARATPQYELRRRSAAARASAEAATLKFLEASSSVEDHRRQLKNGKQIADKASPLKQVLRESEKVLQECEQAHAKRLQEFQAAQSVERDTLAKTSVTARAVVCATAPFFDAEDAYYARLASAKDEVAKHTRTVSEAKERYHRALRNLEEISSAVHAHRANRNSGAPSIPVTPGSAAPSRRGSHPGSAAASQCGTPSGSLSGSLSAGTSAFSPQNAVSRAGTPSGSFSGTLSISTTCTTPVGLSPQKLPSPSTKKSGASFGNAGHKCSTVLQTPTMILGCKSPTEAFDLVLAGGANWL